MMIRKDNWYCSGHWLFPALAMVHGWDLITPNSRPKQKQSTVKSHLTRAISFSSEISPTLKFHDLPYIMVNKFNIYICFRKQLIPHISTPPPAFLKDFHSRHCDVFLQFFQFQWWKNPPRTESWWATGRCCPQPMLQFEYSKQSHGEIFRN